MKTRIVHTKIYDDNWFNSLNIDEKLLFIYYITNSRIGHTGIYEISPRIVSFETGVVKNRVIGINKLFEKASKLYFYNEWTFVIKSASYSGYKGEKNRIAFNEELKRIPQKILNYFNNTVPIQYRYTIDTSINTKSETANNRYGFKDIKDMNENIDPRDIPF